MSKHSLDGAQRNPVFPAASRGFRTHKHGPEWQRGGLHSGFVRGRISDLQVAPAEDSVHYQFWPPHSAHG
jgi:hypothetical protein